MIHSTYYAHLILIINLLFISICSYIKEITNFINILIQHQKVQLIRNTVYNLNTKDFNTHLSTMKWGYFRFSHILLIYNLHKTVIKKHPDKNELLFCGCGYNMLFGILFLLTKTKRSEYLVSTEFIVDLASFGYM